MLSKRPQSSARRPLRGTALLIGHGASCSISAHCRLSALSWRVPGRLHRNFNSVASGVQPRVQQYHVHSIVALACVVALDLQKLGCCVTVATTRCSIKKGSDLIHCVVERSFLDRRRHKVTLDVAHSCPRWCGLLA